MAQPNRRFPPPWKVVELESAFRVEDANGFSLTYVYWRGEPGLHTTNLTKDEARRIAVNIAKLPELLSADLPAMIDRCVTKADEQGRPLTEHLLAMAAKTLDEELE